MYNLSNKIIVVIGGSGLLGSEFSRACAEAGASVVIAEKDEQRGNRLAQELSARYPQMPVVSQKADVRDESSMNALAATLIAQFGHVDGVVNAAYPKTSQFGKAFEAARVDDMLEDLALHVGGCLATAKAFLPHMREKKSGSIVFLGSIYGVAAPRFDIYKDTPMTLPAEYAAAKGATIALARYFASLAGRDGIRCNAISPGGIADGQPQSFIERYSEHLAIGSGLLSPQDIGGILVFLLSDASKQITGQNIIVDGGWTL